jgi:hypothetical protein
MADCVTSRAGAQKNIYGVKLTRQFFELNKNVVDLFFGGLAFFSEYRILTR